MKIPHRTLFIFVSCIVLLGSSRLRAQDSTLSKQSQAEHLAQKLQNPLSNITALPIQNNFGINTSQNEKLGYGLSLQPLHSTSFKKFTLIHRAVFGLGYVPGITQGLELIPQAAPEDGNIDGVWGVSDLNYSFFYSMNKKMKVNWGVGPSINVPTANDNRLGSGKWSAGLSGVVVFQTKRWTFDWVVRQTWSFAGDPDRRDVNQMVLQPLIAFNMGKGWVINTFPTITANWDFEDQEIWTVPLGGGVSKIIMAGIPMSLGLQYYEYVIAPELAPERELRLQLTLVFRK